MLVETQLLPAGRLPDATELPQAQLLLAFGSGPGFAALDPAALRRLWPRAHLLGCSTAGEIHAAWVGDQHVTLTALALDFGRVELASLHVATCGGDRQLGRRLAMALPVDGLRHALVLTDGLQVNGSEFLAGFYSALPPGVSASGGMAGDGERFAATLLCADCAPSPGLVAAAGLYGPRLQIGYGSLGGWEPFGPERMITRSVSNVLFELDGEPALALYRRHLGEHANALPGAALRCPLALRIDPASRRWVVRTVLAVDETSGSLTFAGDLPQGSIVQLMRAEFCGLIEGASGAAMQCIHMAGDEPALALLISCVGRRMVLRQHAREEVEAVRGLLGQRPQITGFYSYGEFAPGLGSQRCELHNQTMTITTLDER